MTYITTAATTTIAKNAYGIHVQINKALTGTVTITDSGNTVAVITATTAAGGFDYFGFQGQIQVTNASTEDITVSVINRR